MARYCEDYPCCGHTPQDPCDYVAPDFTNPEVAARYHIGCDHNAGYCNYEDPEDEDEEPEEYCGGSVSHDAHGGCPGMGGEHEPACNMGEEDRSHSTDFWDDQQAMLNALRGIN